MQGSTRLKTLLIVLSAFFLSTCEDFFEPENALVIEKENFFKDWTEYRSAEMGLYALQQELVDQIIILGELRADLMEITSNADKDLRDVYNFQITRENRFASPTNFYKLIGACNSLINELESNHPEVFNNQNPTDYHRLYGEVKCMRAWAYFNAVRIYGKIPYIWPELTSVDEITEYVNSSREYIDSVNIIYDPGGYYNDTTYNNVVTLERQFLDIDQVIDTFTMELEGEIIASNVGVIHNKENQDLTWNVTIWNQYAYHSLLGQMYLFQGDYVKAEEHFRPIMYNNDSETSDIKFGLDGKFAFDRWKNIFAGLDGLEHIYTLWFGKSYQQQHSLQTYFSKIAPNQYMIKPTKTAIRYWESIWDGMRYQRDDNNPSKTTMREPGEPGDFTRGHGISYIYMRGNKQLKNEEVDEMLELKSRLLLKDVEDMMADVDTVIYKYTYGKQPYDQDANVIIFRAAAIHLYYAEIFNRWEFDQEGVIKPTVNFALTILNNGGYNGNNNQMGVRGRAGFGGEVVKGATEDDGVQIGNIVYEHDPNTNKVTGFKYLNTLQDKQEYIEEKIIEERARELAFEGERFYDLMRIAKRRNDPSFLAEKVASKFEGAKREEIRQFLMNEENWYVPYYE